MVFDSELDIIDYLMRVEFEHEELTSEDAILLLNKFRYYYRKAHSESIQKSYDIERLEKEIKVSETRLEIVKSDIDICDDRYDRLKGKKLSFKERIKGKIF